ncbi:MAG: large subunit ribosomal protein L28 [Kiritimatiellia bacterium]
MPYDGGSVDIPTYSRESLDTLFKTGMFCGSYLQEYLNMAKLNTRGNRSVSKGNKFSRRGIAKKKGGIGLNITGISRRTFKTNMQRKKIRFSDGTVRTMWVRAKDLKAGMYDNPNKADFLKYK